MWLIFWLVTIFCFSLVKVFCETTKEILFFESIFGALIGITYIIERIRNRKSQQTFLALLFVFFFLIIFIPRGFLLSCYPELTVHPYYININSLTYAMFLELLGLGFFLMGYHFKKRSKFIENLGQYIFNRKFSTAGLYFFSGIGTMSKFLWALYSFSYSSIASLLSSIPSQLGYLGLFSTLILLFEKKPLSKFRLIYCILCLSMYILSFLILGMRGIFLTLFFYIVSYFVLTQNSLKNVLQKRIIWISGTVSVLVFVFLFPIMSVYKYQYEVVTLSSYGKERLIQSIESYYNLYKEKSPSNEHNRPFLKLFSRRLGTGLDFLALLIARTPEVWNFQHGKTFLYGFLAPIPRALWQNKPKTSLEGKFYEEYIGRKQIHNRGAAGYTTVGDFWLNFGTLGVIIGIFFFGISVRMFQVFCIGSHSVIDKRRLFGIWYLIIGGSLLVRQTRSISGILTTLTSITIIPLFFMLLITKKRWC